MLTVLASRIIKMRDRSILPAQRRSYLRLHGISGIWTPGSPMRHHQPVIRPDAIVSPPCSPLHSACRRPTRQRPTAASNDAIVRCNVATTRLPRQLPLMQSGSCPRCVGGFNRRFGTAPFVGLTAEFLSQKRKVGRSFVLGVPPAVLRFYTVAYCTS